METYSFHDVSDLIKYTLEHMKIEKPLDVELLEKLYSNLPTYLQEWGEAEVISTQLKPSHDLQKIIFGTHCFNEGISRNKELTIIGEVHGYFKPELINRIKNFKPHKK